MTGSRPTVALVSVAANLLLSPGVLAQAVPEQPIRIQKLAWETDLKANGEFVQIVEQRIKIQTEAGLRSAAQMPFAYNVSMQKFEVVHAYTLKPDGRKVEVRKDAIFVRDLPASTGAPMFADAKVVVVVFPEVAVGDSVEARVRYEQTRPMFAGHYTDLYFLTPYGLVDGVSITLRAPAALPLYVDNEGYTQTRTEKGEAVVYEWTARNAVVEPFESGAVAPIDYAQRLAISTFPTFAEFARAYDGPARAMVGVTPEIRKLADRITEGATGPRDQARLLYDWMAKNIRYVGVFLGTGAVVPHRAEEVLANRYGDCKDYVTLLQALLAAKGLDSTPAMILPGPSFWVSKVPTLHNFNHVITYIPSLDLFLDSTSIPTTFGRLPDSEQGKTALLTRTGERKTTPLDTASDNLAVRRVKYEIGDDGTIAGVTAIEARGWRAAIYREQAKRLTAEKQSEFVRSQTSDSRYRGEGTVEFIGTEERSDTMRLKATYTLKGGIDWPGAGAFEVPAGFRGSGTMSSQVSQGGPAWKRPHVFGAAMLVEEYEIRLPARMKVVALPKDVHFVNAVTSYDATYRLDGKTLHVTRRLADRFQPPLIPAALFNAMEEYSDAIARDLRAQVVYAQE